MLGRGAPSGPGWGTETNTRHQRSFDSCLDYSAPSSCNRDNTEIRSIHPQFVAMSEEQTSGGLARGRPAASESIIISGGK